MLEQEFILDDSLKIVIKASRTHHTHVVAKVELFIAMIALKDTFNQNGKYTHTHHYQMSCFQLACDSQVILSDRSNATVFYWCAFFRKQKLIDLLADSTALVVLFQLRGKFLKTN